MAIQIRRGTNTEWESNNSNIVVGEPAIATDAERFFVGTASGDYAEFANIDVIAPAYDTTTSYVVGDIINYHGKLYSCNAPCSGAFNIGYWNETSLTDILKNLENEITYAQYEIGYANGKLITIDNGASEIPVKDLTLDIEAVQDLHGYDHPWAGGAGKNKLPCREVGTLTVQGLTVTFGSDGTITVNGTATAVTLIPIASDYGSGNKVYLPAGTYTINGGDASNYWVGAFLNKTSGSWDYTSGGVIGSDTFTITEGDYIYPVVRVGNGVSLSNYKFYPMIRPSTESATYEPYENICPISGWDEVNVNAQQKNFLKTRVASGVNSGITWSLNADGTATVSGTATSTVIIPLLTSSQSDNILYLPSGTYKISGGGGTGYWVGIYFNAVTGGWAATTTEQQQFTAEFGDYVAPCIRVGSGTSFSTPYTFYPMISLASVDDTFEPYNGQTYTIDLDGTRYGGTLDVTTGVLTIDKFSYSFTGNETFRTHSTWGNYAFLYNAGVSIKSSYQNQTESISSHLQVVTTGSAWNSLTPNHFMIAGNTYIGLGYDGTQEQLKAWLSAENSNGTPVQVIGLLATPQVVQLTPTQVRTVLGTNNLWNQMNSNNELAYRISNALN